MDNSRNSNDGIARRSLLKGAGKGLAAMTAASYAQVAGANDRISLGVIGPGARS
ncbi:MAG: gfo/Idh/MocA family oxidoreductase, partial [bacterium]|nr:gfo/Idh/MocA family oxidoreductase [bacterium]